MPEADPKRQLSAIASASGTERRPEVPEWVDPRGIELTPVEFLGTVIPFALGAAVLTTILLIGIPTAVVLWWLS